MAGSEATLVGVVIREVDAEPASGQYGDAIGGLALAPPWVGRDPTRGAG